MTRLFIRKFPLSGRDLVLWIFIFIYTGIIYSTVSVVPVIRKWLAERFGHDVYNYLFPVFILLGLYLFFHGVRVIRGTALLQYIIGMVLTASLYTWYLLSMDYAVERVHLLEYGGLSILLYIAFNRKLHNIISVPLALILTYLVGLGDEVIQSFLSNRVAEIRDGVTNAVSGLLGLVMYLMSLGYRFEKGPVSTLHFKILLVAIAVGNVLTGHFLYAIHGFGNRYTSLEAGTIYSSLTEDQLQRINENGTFGSAREREIYYNEAERHLFQRDFYFTNDFRFPNGYSYREVYRAAWENRMLETWYPRYLNEHAKELSGAITGKMDSKVGQDVGATPVVWTDDIRKEVALQSGELKGGYTSRVKSILITDFTFKELLMYQALIMLILGWCWTILPANRRFHA